MRIETNTYGEFEYPERYCMVYEKHYIKARLYMTFPYLSVCVSDARNPRGSKVINIAYRPNIKIEISSVLQSAFADWSENRTVYAHVALRSGSASILSFHTYVIYGKSDLGLLRFLLSLDDNRTVCYFKNFQFSVSLFKCKTDTIYVNGSEYPDLQTGIVDVPVKSGGNISCVKSPETIAVFDSTFDDTFTERYPSGAEESITVIVSDATEGEYIRWLDNSGYIQYYLFDLGTKEMSVNQSDYRKEKYEYERPLASELQIKQACSAQDINTEKFSYVFSILESRKVERYSNGEWRPIEISDGFTLEHDKILRDIEFTFTEHLKTQTL